MWRVYDTCCGDINAFTKLGLATVLGTKCKSLRGIRIRSLNFRIEKSRVDSYQSIEIAFFTCAFMHNMQVSWSCMGKWKRNANTVKASSIYMTKKLQIEEEKRNLNRWAQWFWAEPKWGGQSLWRRRNKRKWETAREKGRRVERKTGRMDEKRARGWEWYKKQWLLNCTKLRAQK